MKKLLLIAVASLALALSSTAFADKQYLVGVGLLNGSGTHNFSGYYDFSEDLDTSGFAFYFGRDINEHARAKVGLHVSEYKGKDWKSLKIENTGVEFDYQLYKKIDQFKPFISLGFDISSWDYEGPFGETLVNDETLTGFGFRLGAGVIAELTDQFEIEAGLIFTKLIWQDIDYVTWSGTHTLEQDTSLVNFQIGANFRF